MFTLFASLARLHIVAVAMTASLAFGWLFFDERHFLLMAVVGLDWFIVNLLNRAADVKEDEQNQVKAASFSRRHPKLIFRLGLGLLLFSLVAGHFFMAALTPWRIAFHLLGAAYNWPLLPGGRRIKTLYFFKNTASAMGFLITLFGYLIAAHGFSAFMAATGFEPEGVGLFILFFFTFEISYEILYDLRDLEGDQAVGAQTFPVVHGPKLALRIIDVLLGVSVLALVLGYSLQLVPWRAAIMAVAPLLQGIWIHRAFSRGVKSTDCVALTWVGAVLLVVYQLWVVFDLPGASLG